MSGPIVSFVCWNRSGLTARNLLALLKTTDDFELHIIDCNSKDNTWDFIETLEDKRIVEKKRLMFNCGAAYAFNYVMAQRKKGQYFVHFDSDACILTSDWVTKFMRVMDEFPEVGAACTVCQEKLNTWKNFKLPFNHMERNNVSIEESGGILATVCVCIRPECMDKIGYFNEETGGTDLDYAARIFIGTDYKHPAFMEERGHLFHEYINDIKLGKRDVYCASIHDEESMKNHYYNREVALENFKYFVDNGN